MSSESDFKVFTHIKKNMGNALIASTLLLFAAYVICKKKSSFSRVFFLFFSVQNCPFFYSKINDSSRVRTTQFSSSRSVVRVSVVPNFLKISLTFVRKSIPMVPIAQWVGQDGSKA